LLLICGLLAPSDGRHVDRNDGASAATRTRYAPPFYPSGVSMNVLQRGLIVALACLPFAAFAQPAPKIFIVDMSRAFDTHPRVQAEQAALKAEDQKATAQLKTLEGQIRALADKMKDQQSRFDDPTVSAAQKEAIRAEASKTGQELAAKQMEGQQLVQKTQNAIQERVQKLRGQVIADVSKAAADIARRKGGNLVYDRGSMVYADPAFDITTEVIAEVAKIGRATPAATTPATPAAPR
jgi:outer membrane protein